MKEIEYIKGLLKKQKMIDRHPASHLRPPPPNYFKKHQALSKIKDGDVEHQLPPEKISKWKWGDKVIKRILRIKKY